jgi:predicted DNA-binding antitoxin AbrB/MazE fold protein
MLKTVRAVYEHGMFRPLEDTPMNEGQEVELTIKSSPYEDYTPSLEHIKTNPISSSKMQKIYRWLDKRQSGTKPLSTMILEERGE